LPASPASGETIAVRGPSGIVSSVIPAADRNQSRPRGLAKGEFTVPDDFNAPDPDLEALIYGEA
jgi:hypothetical protein